MSIYSKAILIFLISMPSFAFLSIKKRDCSLKYVSNEYPELQSTLIKMIKLRKFTPIPHTSSKRITPDDYYLEVVREYKKDKFFQDCQVGIKLKKAESNYPSSRDQTLYKGLSKRQFPRITPKGDERCVRALQDSFVHIPVCIKIR